jgi:uncharacterized glyoxalase superfamily protein PhnB
MSGLEFCIEEVAFGAVAVQVHSGGEGPAAEDVRHEDPFQKLISATLNTGGTRVMNVWDKYGNIVEIPMGGNANTAYLWSPTSEAHAITTNDASWYSDII